MQHALFNVRVLIKEISEVRFLNNNCFRIGTLEFQDGAEIWKIFSNTKENIKLLIKELNKKKNRTVTLLSVKNFDMEIQTLTQKQADHLDYLYLKGYFEIPKKITLQDASKDLKTSPENINKHLTRALKKIISQYEL